MEKLPAVLNKFKGSFANAEALPVEGTAGDYAICTDTDTVWVWDEEKEDAPGWIDTGKKGSVTSVNGKTGAVTIALADLGVTIEAAAINGLPDQVAAKVATADIVNALNSDETAKPLAAAQGKVLDGKITTVGETAAETDFAIVEAGGSAPETLRDGGMYFEKATASESA